MRLTNNRDGPLHFPRIGLQAPALLLPRPGISLEKWAVVACDQYTWQPEYWQEVERHVAEAPSSLRLILPEIYLKTADCDQRIEQIHRCMGEYLEQGILAPQRSGFVLVERQPAGSDRWRKGLMAALDLEHYDYRQGSRTLIRATEGTVVERLPPRIRIRQGASLEVPHTMVLIDDPEHSVIEPLSGQSVEPLYDFELMQGGGHVRGYRVDRQELIQQVADRLARLADRQACAAPCAGAGKATLLYALGDGNHSFAAAKDIWERLKRQHPGQPQLMRHPARYALVELVNVHDQGLTFAPIHRLVFEANVEDLRRHLENYYRRRGNGFSLRLFTSQAAWEAAGQQREQGRCAVRFVAAGQFGSLCIDDPQHRLEVASLQAFLDDYLQSRPHVRMDYIHGEQAVVALGKRPGSVGFCLPGIDKKQLFRNIVQDGALPRKTFSLGEADEKRFYLECRRIVP